MKRGKKPITRYLQDNSRFRSITELKVHLLEEFGDDLSGTISFDLGYYEKRSTKCLITSSEDLNRMYELFKTSGEVLLWCDGGTDGPDKSRKRKRDTENDDNVDAVYLELKEKHQNKFTVPQLRLWARMIHCDTHDSYDKPPSIPMFSGSEPKRQKKESAAETIADSIVALSKAISPPPVKSNSSISVSTVGISPGKSIDLRMKNLQQLRYIQKLFQDNILSEQEYLEQKENVLDSLRKLN